MLGKIVIDLRKKIRICPPDWPNRNIEISPSDLARFVPHGSGVYGYQEPKKTNPFVGAPSQEANGGVIYFENDVTKQDFEALIRVLGIQPAWSRENFKNFAAFMSEAEIPKDCGFIAQMRIVPKFGLRYLFKAITDDEYEKFPEQKLDIADAFWTFIEYEKDRWGTCFDEDERKGLRGKFGGDGYFAREELSFGLMVENGYYNISRIWSRAWLVTK